MIHDVYLGDEIVVDARLDEAHGPCVDVGELTMTAADARRLAADVIGAAALAEEAAARRWARCAPR